MKTKIWISFNALPVPGGVATILEPAGCGSDVADVNDVPILNQIFVHVKLEEHDQRVAKLLAQLKQYGVEFDSHTYTEYSEEDCQNARLLWMSPDVNIRIHAGFSLGTKYDMTNACPNCETGAKQTSPLYMKHKDMAKLRKHRAIASLWKHILVDGGMRKKLIDAGITGISFGDVRARHENGKWSEVARDQILIEHTMPPMRGELTEKDEQYLCKVCRRGGRITWPPKPYREEDLVGMRDFNLTWEWFGEFRTADHRFGILRSNPDVLVTPKVMNIFREAGVKTFDWRPVAIEE
jgi:hypothetical protein